MDSARNSQTANPLGRLDRLAHRIKAAWLLDGIRVKGTAHEQKRPQRKTLSPPPPPSISSSRSRLLIHFPPRSLSSVLFTLFSSLPSLPPFFFSFTPSLFHSHLSILRNKPTSTPLPSPVFWCRVPQRKGKTESFSKKPGRPKNT